MIWIPKMLHHSILTVEVQDFWTRNDWCNNALLGQSKWFNLNLIYGELLLFIFILFHKHPVTLQICFCLLIIILI